MSDHDATLTGTGLTGTGLPDAAAGIVLASAAGDALGAGYEYGSAPLPATGPCAMIGGGLGGFAPGEWTDDTSMAVPILQAQAAHPDLTAPAALDAIATGFLAWHATSPPDVGGHTGHMLARGAAVLRRDPDASPADALTGAAVAAWRTGAVSNGGLMRTGPTALPYLASGDLAAAADAAAAVSALTHAEDDSRAACAAWTAMTVHAARGGAAVDALDVARSAAAAVTDARTGDRVHSVLAAAAAGAADGGGPGPGRWRGNGEVLTCAAAAFAAVHPLWAAAADDPAALPRALDRAVKSGGDTDTVGAVAGSLAGAVWGARAVPASWRDRLHGWPGLRQHDLVALAVTHAPAPAHS